MSDLIDLLERHRESFNRFEGEPNFGCTCTAGRIAGGYRAHLAAVIEAHYADRLALIAKLVSTYRHLQMDTAEDQDLLNRATAAADAALALVGVNPYRSESPDV
jgi:hypothetical protein